MELTTDTCNNYTHIISKIRCMTDTKLDTKGKYYMISFI